jgi:membrane protease YdiL (CAAX protease family)
MYLKYFTYITLLFSILSLWIPNKTKYKPWEILLFISLIFSLISSITNIIGFLSIILFYFLIKSYLKCNPKCQYILWLLVFIFSLALHGHFIPGFHNLLVLSSIQFTHDAIPYTVYLNFDKTITGLIIIGLTFKLAKNQQEWKSLFQQVIYRSPIIILIIALSIIFNYIKFDPKVPPYLSIWIINNLFFVCLAEEGFWRGFVQQSLSKLKYQYAEYVALIVSAILFGICHYAGGTKYIILATIAGIIYGWIYKITKRIEASILMHFILNLLHILLFTYPALK